MWMVWPSKEAFFSGTCRLLLFTEFYVCCTHFNCRHWIGFQEKRRCDKEQHCCKIHGRLYWTTHTLTDARANGEQCKRVERSEKRFAIYAKIKVIKWFGVCLVGYGAAFHLCVLHTLHTPLFVSYSFVCSWCDFCVESHAAVVVAARRGFRNSHQDHKYKQ